ncbi:hypothetical protein Tco_0720937 [Tanacetum coccineum]
MNESRTRCIFRYVQSIELHKYKDKREQIQADGQIQAHRQMQTRHIQADKAYSNKDRFRETEQIQMQDQTVSDAGKIRRNQAEPKHVVDAVQLIQPTAMEWAKQSQSNEECNQGAQQCGFVKSWVQEIALEDRKVDMYDITKGTRSIISTWTINQDSDMVVNMKIVRKKIDWHKRL